MNLLNTVFVNYWLNEGLCKVPYFPATFCQSIPLVKHLLEHYFLCSDYSVVISYSRLQIHFKHAHCKSNNMFSNGWPFLCGKEERGSIVLHGYTELTHNSHVKSMTPPMKGRKNTSSKYFQQRH
jgi:hypothetical protein